jgi:prolyl-tRNA synthetase
MGCYGIGIGRTLATVVEVMSDEAGIIWPKAIAPYQVHLLSLDASGEVYDKAVELYEKLLELGFEVLLDDRDVRPGSKFADSDLIGIPLRITIGRKSLETGLYELKLRTDSGTVNLTYDELIAYLIEFYG